MIKKGDVILIAVLLIVAAIYFGFSHNANEASVYYDGDLFTVLPLNKNKTVEVGNTVIKVEDGKVFFEYSDCPNKICMKSGKLYKAGQTASCVPNGVVIVLSGADEPDGVTG